MVLVFWQTFWDAQAYFCATTCFVLWIFALFFKANGWLGPRWCEDSVRMRRWRKVRIRESQKEDLYQAISWSLSFIYLLFYFLTFHDSFSLLKSEGCFIFWPDRRFGGLPMLWRMSCNTKVSESGLWDRRVLMISRYGFAFWNAEKRKKEWLDMLDIAVTVSPRLIFKVGCDALWVGCGLLRCPWSPKAAKKGSANMQQPLQTVDVPAKSVKLREGGPGSGSPWRQPAGCHQNAIQQRL